MDERIPIVVMILYTSWMDSLSASATILLAATSLAWSVRIRADPCVLVRDKPLVESPPVEFARLDLCFRRLLFLLSSGLFAGLLPPSSGFVATHPIARAGT